MTSKKGYRLWEIDFVKEKFIDPYILSVDSTLLKDKGYLWHKSSMIKVVVSRSGIDINDG
ncbi:MAG TPA: hypothetical protein VFJ05_03370 [Nitrososphaeraceae archaeon]|nr:hypothetical protein [Nitrososphaeraceae archaeon]